MNNRLLQVLQGKENNYLYPFFWMHGASEETLDEYVEKIKESGCGAFCVESRPHPDFLGEGWWKDMDFLLQKAEELDMKVWILDDAHFPTGYANGRIKTAPDSLKQCYLKHQELDFVGPVRNGKVAVCVPGQDDGFVQNMDELAVAVLTERIHDEDFEADRVLRDVTEEIVDGRLTLNLPEGRYRLYLVSKARHSGKNFNDYIDMTNPESVHLLLEETYEKHYAHYADKFGTVIEGFFSDEPGFYNVGEYILDYQIGSEMPLPWNSYIAEEFLKKLHEYGVTDKDMQGNSPQCAREYLPALWFPCGSNTKKIRAAYMDALTVLYQKNFTGQLSDWCHQHNVIYVGHVIEDNNVHARLGCGPGHYFRSLSGQDMAGIDVVLQQILPGKDCLQFGMSSHGNQDGAFFFYGLGKLGASMAHLDARTQGRAMCEIFGAYGWAEGVSLMKWLADHMLVRGLNYFVPHAFSEHEFPDPDCPPHFYAGGNNPQFAAISRLFRYMNRMCHLLSGGRSRSKIGIVYHAESEWLGKTMYFHTIGKELYCNQLDYEVVPVESLQRAEIENGVIRMGNLELTCLLVPWAEQYPMALRDCVRRCVDAGVEIWQVKGELPGNSRESQNWNAHNSQKGERLENCSVISLGDVVSWLKGFGYEEIQIPCEVPENIRKWIRHYHYQMEDGRHFHMLFHEGKNGVFTGKVKFPEYGCLLRYDAMDNRISVVSAEDGKLAVCLYPGESAVFIGGEWMEENAFINGKYSGADGVPEVKDFELFDGKIVLSAAHYGTLGTFETLAVLDTSAYDYLPDIQEISPQFAGVIRYELEIDSGEHVLKILDLGEAKDGVQVWVNGNYAGMRLSAPYCYDLSEISCAGRNHICIEAATTLVNVFTDTFSKHMVIEQEGVIGPIRYK